MTPRITIKDLELVITRMQEAGIDVALDWQYGAPRPVNQKGNVDLGPRGSKREVFEWLHTYWKGWLAGFAAASSRVVTGLSKIPWEDPDAVTGQ